VTKAKAPVLVLAAAFLLPLCAQTSTQTLDFPTAGTLRFDKSIGELTIEGWDQPRVEITTIKSIKTGEEPKDGAAWLNRVSVTAERRGNEVVVQTAFPKRFVLIRPVHGGMTPVELEYRVKAPREAMLQIDHQSGEIHIQNMTGAVRATDGRGQITILVPEDASYIIDARTRIGAVDSDFPGTERRKLKFGHAWTGQTASGRKLDLRIGFGDITILKVQTPSPDQTQK
jgi:hypothetical protein